MTTTRRARTVSVTAEVAGWSSRGAVVSNQLHASVEQAVVAVLGSSPADAERARAYCGPAHGHTWLLEGESSWPPRIMLVGRDGRSTTA